MKEQKKLYVRKKGDLILLKSEELRKQIETSKSAYEKLREKNKNTRANVAPNSTFHGIF